MSAFYIARTASDLPLELAYPSLFVIIAYFMGGLKLTAGAFFASWLSVLLIILVSQSLGMLLGVMFMNPKTAMTAASVFVLTCMLCGKWHLVMIVEANKRQVEMQIACHAWTSIGKQYQQVC